MLLKQVSVALFGLALATEAAIIPEFNAGLARRQNNGGNKGGNGGNNGGNNNGGNNNGGGGGGAANCLDPSVIQANSNKNGQDVPTAGQANSLTDANNFINFCKGQTITNGLQVKGGSCNSIVMGKIPDTANMISGIITSPKPMEDLKENQTFDVSVQTKGLAAGSFTNAAETYYSAPQDLDGSGKIIGHTHLTIQDLGNSLSPSQPPDPAAFVFFKGVNDAGNNQGLLSATVTGGLPKGNYRVCSMTSSSNHQPVLMPVAQRGAQDDCQKFTVGAGTGGANNGGNGGNAGGNQGGNAGGNAGQGGNQGGNGGGKTPAAAAPATGNNGGNKGGNGATTGGNNGGNAGAAASSSSSAAAAATPPPANNGGGNGGNKGGNNNGATNGGNKGGNGGGAAAASSSTSSAAAAATSAPPANNGGNNGGNKGGNNAGGGGAATGGAIGGAAPAVTNSGNKDRPFSVNGATFVNESAAKQRSCDIQNNACSDAVNGGKAAGKTLADCTVQQTACNAK